MGKHLALIASKATVASSAISPKVKAGALWAVVAIVALAALNGITPEMLATLGPWQFMAQNVIVAVSGLIASYLKTDPLRIIGGEVVNEVEAEVEATEQ